MVKLHLVDAVWAKILRESKKTDGRFTNEELAPIALDVKHLDHKGFLAS